MDRDNIPYGYYGNQSKKSGKRQPFQSGEFGGDDQRYQIFMMEPDEYMRFYHSMRPRPEQGEGEQAAQKKSAKVDADWFAILMIVMLFWFHATIVGFILAIAGYILLSNLHNLRPKRFFRALSKFFTELSGEKTAAAPSVPDLLSQIQYQRLQLQMKAMETRLQDAEQEAQLWSDYAEFLHAAGFCPFCGADYDDRDN